MKEEKKTSLNGLIYLTGIMVIIRHVVQIATNIMLLSIGYDPAVVYNIAIGIIIIPLIVLILMQKKYALYAFFALQAINAIVISYLTGDWAVNLSVTAIICTVVAAALCLKHDGVSAWKAILDKKETVTPTQEANPKPDIEGKQASDTFTSDPTPVNKEPKHKEPFAKTQTADPQKKKRHINLIPSILLLSIIAFAAVTAGVSYIVLSHQEKPKHKEPNKPLIGKYVYIDKDMVIHTKNGCKAVYKDHNSQSVQPVEPQCLSYGSLDKVCSACVTEKQIDCLKDTFDKYRQAYLNVGKIHEALDAVYSDIPPIREFRQQMRNYEVVREVYGIMKKDGADVGTIDEFMEYIGLTKPAKRKTKTQL